MNIVFLLPVISEARCHKRIKALKNLDIHPKILAFERYYYKGKPILDDYQVLGTLKHGEYHKRFFPYLKAFFMVRKAVKDAQVVYAFGLDMLLLGWLACYSMRGSRKLVYEVADIREVLIENKILSRCLRWLERFILKHVDVLVVTSKAYITEYYQKIQRLSGLHYEVIENKLDKDSIPELKKVDLVLPGDVIRIGYFGVIRCRRSWEILKQVAEKGAGKFQIYIRGIPRLTGDFEKEVQKAPNVIYDGPYVSPDDLPEIYNQVNLVWACYTYQGNGIGNWLWARTNRFYESCFFKKPMINMAGTEDGRLVKDLNIGKCIDMRDVEKSINHILNINYHDLIVWQSNINKLPEHTYIYTNEHNRLLKAIKNKTGVDGGSIILL